MRIEMSAEALEIRRTYQREYRRRNRDKINRQRKNWRAENRDKVQRYNQEYWERKAGMKKGIRASWEDYGITPERLNELTEIVRSGKYDAMVLSAACRADEMAAEHIVLSVKESASYEALEAKQALGEIERVTLGRTDFYGARRLFFHYLDCALKELRTRNNEGISKQGKHKNGGCYE